MVGVLAAGISSAALAVPYDEDIPHTTSWLANTNSGYNASAVDREQKYLTVQHAMNDVWTSPTGRCFAVATGNDGGHDAGVYENGQVVTYLTGMAGAGLHAGSVVSGNSQYVFVGYQLKNPSSTRKLTGDFNRIINPEYNHAWYGIRRFDLNGNSVPHVVPNVGPPYSNAKKDLTIVNTDGGDITGIAASETRVFVGDPATGAIHIYQILANHADPADMTEVGSFAVERSSNLAYDKVNDRLWVLQTKDATHPWQVACYAPDPVTADAWVAQPALTIALPTGVEVSGLAVDITGHLYVADNGVNQQIRIYTDLYTTPVLDRTFGVTGGVFAGTGATIGTVGPLRFFGISGVGVDDSGKIYVACKGMVNNGAYTRGCGSRLESYTSTGSLNWSCRGHVFSDSAGIDPNTNGADVYCSEEHFKMNLGNTTPGSEWSYYATTLNPFKYPNDMRQNGTATYTFDLARFAGKQFMFVSYAGQGFGIYRFNSATDGEIAIPCVLFAKTTLYRRDGTLISPFQPGKNYIWTDLNGDGDYQANEYDPVPAYGGPGTHRGICIDKNGDIWMPYASTLWHFRFGGLNSVGAPQYSWATAERLPAPAPLTDMHGVYYNLDTDSMFLTGFRTGDDPPIYGQHIGTTVVCYDDWSEPLLRKKRWGQELDLPRDGASNPQVFPLCFRVAGDHMFVQYRGINKVDVYRATDKYYEGRLLPSTSIGDYTTEWVDIALGMNAFLRTNGEYLVFSEENIFNKILLQRWQGPTQTPARPTGLNATAMTSTKINLYWTDHSTNESGFKIERKTAGGSFTQIATVGANTAYYEDTGLTPSTTYTYQVRAYNAGGDSAYSNEASATTPNSSFDPHRHRLLNIDFQNGLNPFTASEDTDAGMTLTSDVPLVGNIAAQFTDASTSGTSAGSKFSCVLTANHPLVRRINETLTGTTPATFIASTKVRRVTASNDLVTGYFYLEASSSDGNPPTTGLGRDRTWTSSVKFGAATGAAPGYMEGNLVTLNEVNFPQGYSGPAWRGMQFTVTPDGTGKTINTLTVIFNVRVDTGATPEAVYADDITVDEYIP